MLDEIRRRLMQPQTSQQMLDADPRMRNAGAAGLQTLAPDVPQDQQTEAADETPDTTSDDTHQPAVAPAPDVPPEVAIANSQTNAQAAGQEPPAAPPVERPEMANGLPVIHMSENPAERMNPAPAGPVPPPPRVDQPDSAPSFPSPSGQSPEPNYAQLADTARSARMRDSENINRWNLGEGLKEAFAIARGQHYGGQRYSGPLEEPAVEKEQAAFESRLRNQLAMKRQAAQDQRQAAQDQRQAAQDKLHGRLTEQDIALKRAEELKALRPPDVKPDTKGDPKAYKAVLKADPLLLQQYHNNPAELAKAIDALPDDEKALSDFAAGIRGQSKGINVAVTQEGLGEKKNAAEKQLEEGGKVQSAWEDTDQSLRLIAEEKALIQKHGRGLFLPTNAEERAAQVRAKDIIGQITDMAQKATIDANRMPNNTVYRNMMENVVGDPTKFGLGKLLDGPELQGAAIGEYEKTLLHRREVLRAHHGSLSPEAQSAHPLYEPKSGGGDGKVTVTNGKETYRIDKGDVAAAQKDGFRVAP